MLLILPVIRDFGVGLEGVRGASPAVLRIIATKTPPETPMPRKPRLIGYMRVSRSRQRTDRQLDSLTSAGCWRVYSDKASGKRCDRQGLAKALAVIRAGDKLTVDSIDRLGRGIVQILTIVEELEARGASLLSLSENCDTVTENGRIQAVFLAVIAEIEHVQITRRTRAGVQAAAARGRRRGGTAKMTKSDVSKAFVLMKHGETADLVAARFRVGRSTLFRYLATRRADIAVAKNVY